MLVNNNAGCLSVASLAFPAALLGEKLKSATKRVSFPFSSALNRFVFCLTAFGGSVGCAVVVTT